MRAVSTPLVLVPLLITPGLLFHYDVTPKAIVLLAGSAVALALYRPFRLLDLLLGAQAISLVISTLASTDPALSLLGSNWRRFGLVTQLALLVWTYAASRQSSLSLLRAIAASGGLAAIYGIAQYFGWDPLLPRDSYHVGEGVWTIVRPPGTLGHAGYFAVYLLHVAFAGVAVAGAGASPKWQRVGAIATSLAVAAILLNGARGALLGLAAGAVTLALIRQPRLTRRRLGVMLALLAAIAVFYLSPAGLQLRARARWVREDPGGGGRLTLWTDTLRMSTHRWLAGYGPETYSSEYPRFQSEELARRFPERYFESPHNIFLDALAGQGVPGLAALAGLTALGLWGLRRSGALLAGLVASVVANQFVSFTIPTALLFYATIAMGAGVEAPERPQRRWFLLPLTLALAAGAGVLAWSDFWLAQTRRALAAGRLRVALENYRLVPRGLDTSLWYSRALLAAAPQNPEAWREAFLAAQRAAATSGERPNAWYSLAAFYATQNDFPNTERCLRVAIAWAPRWYKPRWMLAQVLEQAGRLEEAEAEARRAAELNNGHHPEVAETWVRIRARRQHK